MRFPCLRIPCTPIGWPTVSLWLPLNAPPGTPYCGSSECWPGGCRRAAPGLPGLRPALVNGTTSWLCPVDLAPAGRPWAEAACALTAARILLVDGAVPSPRILQLVRPFLGRTWETAEDLTELHAALPPPAQSVLRGIEAPEDLWRADAGLRATPR